MLSDLNDSWLTSIEVRQIFGGVSAMTIWRWTRHVGFPEPDMIIQHRKYWRRSTIHRWAAAREQQAIDGSSITNPD